MSGPRLVPHPVAYEWQCTRLGCGQWNPISLPDSVADVFVDCGGCGKKHYVTRDLLRRKA